MKTNSARAPRILAISDGRAGNARQAGALADAVARRIGGAAQTVTAAPRPPLHLMPPALTPLWSVPALYDRPPEAALAVGCGRRVAPLLAWLKATGRARAAQVLNPQMRLSAFDLVIAPAHDGLRAANVVETLGGLNDMTPGLVAEEATRWRERLAHLPTPRAAVMVGGPSRSAGFGPRATSALLDGLARLKAAGAGLMITPSRRTPPDLLDALRETGGWVWDGTGDNPYPAILGLAEAAVVTADSVNMASEAATAGLPLFISPVDRLADKHARFHAALEAHGASRPFAGELARWDYAPLRETERAAARAADFLAG